MRPDTSSPLANPAPSTSLGYAPVLQNPPLTPEPTLTETPAPPAVSPADFASQVYGDRLIQQIVIPVIGVDSPVVPVGWRLYSASDPATVAAEWDSPGAAVGWVETSALPDQSGNVILYGHNNMYTAVFEELGKLKARDGISMQTGERTWEYQVAQVLILPMLGASAEQQAAYQVYLLPTTTPRLTLISCWPPVSNTHRVVVIAYPAQNP